MLNLRSRAARRREWLSKERLQAAFARSLRPKMASELTRVARVAAKAYKKDGQHAIEDAITDHAHRIQRLLIPTYIAVATSFGKRAMAVFKKDMAAVMATKDTEQELSDRVAKFARNRSRKAMAQVSASTKDRINRIITKGIEDGLDTNEIADRIEERTGGKIGEARAAIIAQTEVHSAANAGELESIQSLGIPLEKEWMSMADELVRPDHQEANGQVVDLNDSFDVGDDELLYPGDPDGAPEQIVNCRCIMVYNEPSKG